MKNDGGPAFPNPYPLYRHKEDGSIEQLETCLSIRDYFAGQALIGMAHELIKGGYPKKECFIEGYPEGQLIAQTAYMLSDAMLAEREKEPKP